MSKSSIGVAVIGAGMAGRAHASGYRSAPAVFGPACPRCGSSPSPTRTSRSPRTPRGGTATSAPRRAGRPSPRPPTSTSSASSSPTRCTARSSRRCSPPASTCCARSRWPRRVADGAGHGGPRPPSLRPGRPRIGFTFRRSPADQRDPRAGPRRQSRPGRCTSTATTGATTAADPDAPMSWRYKGGPGSGALADIGSHLIDIGEFLVRPDARRSAARCCTTTVTDRAGAAGHGLRPRRRRAVSDVRGAGRERRRRHVHRALRRRRGRHLLGLPDRPRPRQHARLRGLRRARRGQVRHGPGGRVLGHPPAARRPGLDGYNQVLVGPAHPYINGGLPMDFPGVGHGQNDLFAFQARAFLEQVAGLDRPARAARPCRRPAQPHRDRRRLAGRAGGAGRRGPVDHPRHQLHERSTP